MGHAKIILRPTPIIRKQMGQMAKLFGLWENSKLRDATQKKINPQPSMKEGTPDFLSQTRGIRTKHVTRRQIVLNRHFTEVVSDVLAMNFSSEISKLGMQITSIETKKWNRGVRIYYTKNGTYDENLHKELAKLETPLRYTISQRRLIGKVPQVNFVYDTSLDFDKSLEKAMEKASLNELTGEETKALNKITSGALYVTKDIGSHEEKLISKKFSAPPDMDNNLLGLNYAELYDEVAINLSSGRGKASRMEASKTYLTISKPLFRETLPMRDLEEDPADRVLSMKKFLINQRLKVESKTRLRRKEELLAQNKFKWVEAEPGDDDAKVAPDIVEEE